MLQDCLKVFQEEIKKKTDAFIVDVYTPKDGTYVVVNMKDDVFVKENVVDIKFNKKTGKLEVSELKIYNYIAYLDYFSKLVEMNKPIDPKKIIHSNNIYSFFIKKEALAEGKLKDKNIDDYYDILSNPRIKYTKKSAKLMYEEVEEEIGKVSVGIIDRIKEWIKNNIHNLELDLTKKDYLKIFFVYSDEMETRELYKQEGTRYLIPNLYNSNDFNVSLNGETFGLPNDNMGMNAKKPYLENKSRKISVPYLLNKEEALLHGKFFDYLMGQASQGKTNIYFDYDLNKMYAFRHGEELKKITSGCLLRIRKGKEVEIHDFEIISDYNPNLKRPFYFKRIIEDDRKIEGGIQYGRKNKLYEIENLIDDILFGKKLSFNYFTDPGDINITDGVIKNLILTYRKVFHEWFYQGKTANVKKVIDKLTLKVIKNSVNLGYNMKAKNQLNLRCSLIDYFEESERMENKMSMVKEALRGHIDQKEWDFESDEEYYYAVGQLTAIYYRMNKSKSKSPALFNSIFNGANSKSIKEKLIKLHSKYNYYIKPNDVRIGKLIGHIHGYQVKEKKVCTDSMLEGFYDTSVVYMKKED